MVVYCCLYVLKDLFESEFLSEVFFHGPNTECRRNYAVVKTSWYTVAQTDKLLHWFHIVQSNELTDYLQLCSQVIENRATVYPTVYFHFQAGKKLTWYRITTPRESANVYSKHAPWGPAGAPGQAIKVKGAWNAGHVTVRLDDFLSVFQLTSAFEMRLTYSKLIEIGLW